MAGTKIVAPNVAHRVSQVVITSYNVPTPTHSEDDEDEQEPWQDSAAWQDLLAREDGVL